LEGIKIPKLLLNNTGLVANENEIMVLDVKKSQVVGKLKKLNAKPVGKYHFKRIEFLLDGDAHGKHSWGRVRSDGKNTTITLKEMTGSGSFKSMEEYEIKTDNFENAVKVICKITKSKHITYFENQRDAYQLGRTSVTIDKWPKIPYFVEIEAPSMKIAKQTYKKLQINGKLIANTSIHKIYENYGLEFRKVMSKNDNKLKRLINK
jgi:adenylate cyclase, class 2